MNARDIAVTTVALLIGCLGPTAALAAGLQSATGTAPVVVGALIAVTLLGGAGVLLCRDDEDEVPESQNKPQF